VIQAHLNWKSREHGGIRKAFFGPHCLMKSVYCQEKKQHLLVATLKELIAYGAGEEEDLQNINDSKKEFAERLTAKGVPDTVCDLLFGTYVVASKRY